MKILNFGSLNVDYVYQVDHMVLPGETQASAGMDIFLGGKGFNQSVALAKAGAGVWHAGIIGEDGADFLKACREYGIHAEHIRTMEGRSGHTIIQVDRDGQNCILLHGGSNRAFTREWIDETLDQFDREDFVLLQNEVNLPDYIIDRAFARGMRVILNPSPFDDGLKACDFSKVYCFLLNEIEGMQLTGEKDLEKIPQRILERYPDARVVLTLGSDGAVYADRETTIRQESFPTDAVDTTAAGDTFTGYFIAGLMEGSSLERALRTAAKAASIAVSRKGASPSIPWKEEVQI